MEYSRNFYQILNNEEIFEKIVNEKNDIGYYNLPYKDISQITNYASSVKQKIIINIGIGGSSLGAKAIYKFLKSSRTSLKRMIFLDTIDPLEINYLISDINLEDCHFIIVSKSGNTVEPISVFKYISSLVEINENNSVIISETNNSLHSFAKKNKLRFFEIDKDIGGRFSVFSVAGLVPLSIAGVNIQKLLNGCREVSESFFSKKYYYEHIMNKARFLVENKSRFNNNVIFSYSSIFECFNKWFVQLWAESLGKKNINGTRQGLTPISLIGPQDQHSFLQLILEGPRDKTVTFFKIKNLGIDTIIPKIDNFSDFETNYLDNLSFKEVINAQADSTIESILQEKDIPCDVITISQVDEFNIATLMFRYQLLVSCIGKFLQINPYDQPGVEMGKILLKQKFQNSD